MYICEASEKIMASVVVIHYHSLHSRLFFISLTRWLRKYMFVDNIPVAITDCVVDSCT